MSRCDYNAQSSNKDPVFVGKSPHYSVSFSTSGMLVSKGSTLELSNINITRCRCAQKGDDGLSPDGGPRTGEVIELKREPIIAAPNPTSDQVNLIFDLTENGPVTLTAYDALGRRMSQVLHREYREAGVHQIWVNMGDWPVGMYTFEVSTAKSNESIMVHKQ